MKRLENKVAVITSGGEAIARGIAIRFAREGARVAIIDENSKAGGETASLAGDNAEFIAATLTSKASIQDAINEVGAKYGRIDILVVGGDDAPGQETWISLTEKTEDDFEKTLHHDVVGPLWAMQAAYPYMRDNGGSIINIFSPFGEYASRKLGDHMAGRWGAMGLARTAAHEWGADQIRVNTLVPLADTPVFKAYRDRDPDYVDNRIEGTALQRVGDPVRDIGGAAVFLASDDTCFLTGQMVYADGGDFMTAPVLEAVWDR